MEKNVNTKSDSNNASHKNNYKFSSELLNRPFSSNTNIKEDKFNLSSTSFNNNTDNFNFSSSSFYNNNEMNTSKISSVCNSINFTKKEINEFNSSNNNNNNLNNSTLSNNSETSKKRKPFEKLTFGKNEFNTSDLHNISESANKTNEETQLTNNTKNIHIVSITNNNNLTNLNESNMDYMCNLTHLTEKEKTFIKTQSKNIDTETLEKAKLFNSQFQNSVPFWINFFTEIEEDNLHTNSSYFKVDDKDKYVNNLIQMVKRDAELYDVMKNHQKVKSNVKNNLKNLLITQINPVNEDPSINESDKSRSEVSHEALDQTQNQNQESTGDQKLKDKLTELLAIYDKLDEKEKKLIKKTTNFEEYKLKMLSEGKATNLNLTDKFNKQISQVEERIKNCSPRNKKEEFKEIETFKLIDNITFDETDEFKEEDYSNVEFGAYQSSSIKRLLEIDRKLHQIDPSKYKKSINSELRNIQKDFIQGKQQRQKNFESKYNKEVEKAKFQKDKKTIFDIKFVDNKKINYKDYLKENQTKKQKANVLNNLDQEITSIREKPVDEERKKKILKELEDYHINNQNTDEYKEKMKKIPGFYNEEEINNQFIQLEKRENEKKKLIVILEEKFRERDKMMDEKINEYKEDFRQPYEDLMKDVEREYIDNKALMNRCDQLEKYILDAEETIGTIDNKFKRVKEQSEIYKKLWNDAEEAFKPFDWGEDISNFPEPDDVENELNVDF